MSVDLTQPIAGPGGGSEINTLTQSITIARVDNYNAAGGEPPAEKFEQGKKFLDAGIPGEARRLIQEAIVGGQQSAQTQFFLFLALMSGRSFEDLSDEEVRSLNLSNALERVANEDDWSAGFQAICRLVEKAGGDDSDQELRATDELDRATEPVQRLIYRHLDQHLAGTDNEQKWRSQQTDAARGQLAGARLHRAWMFFEADPAAPRVAGPSPASTNGSAWLQLIGGATLLTFAWLKIGSLVLRDGQVLGILGYLLVPVGGCLLAFHGLEWRSRVEQLRRKINEYETGASASHPPPADGFAANVDKRFDYYFNKHLPRGLPLAVWRKQAAAVQKSIRDEMVHAYRETKTTGPEVNWLIRYRVKDISRRWTDGSLRGYRSALQVPTSTKVGTATGLVISMIGALRSLSVAGQVSALAATGLMFLAAIGGGLTAAGWLRIMVDRRIFTAETAERDRLRQDCEIEYRRWRKRLSDTPGDSEMVTWLRHDRMILLQRAMRHYKLNPNDVTACAFIEAPGGGQKKARVPGGPWRYSTYKIVVFIVTPDGVRQFQSNLRFETAQFSREDRFNYRFDAVSSVSVSDRRSDQRVLELTLVDGKSREICLSEPPDDASTDPAEDSTINNLTLESSGLARALHILEGIAADGKEWISRERQRGAERRRERVSTVRNLREQALHR